MACPSLNVLWTDISPRALADVQRLALEHRLCVPTARGDEVGHHDGSLVHGRVGAVAIKDARAVQPLPSHSRIKAAEPLAAESHREVDIAGVEERRCRADDPLREPFPAVRGVREDRAEPADVEHPARVFDIAEVRFGMADELFTVE